MEGEEGREFAWNTWHPCRRALDHFSSAWLANVSGLAWKMFTGERRRMPMPPFPPLSLSLFFSISSSVGWFNRETRNEKSAGTKSAKLRPILVVDSILLLLLLRKCVDIPTVMSYVKLSPTFSVTLVSPTYVF